MDFFALKNPEIINQTWTYVLIELSRNTILFFGFPRFYRIPFYTDSSINIFRTPCTYRDNSGWWFSFWQGELVLCLDEAETLVDIIDILAAALKASSEKSRDVGNFWRHPPWLDTLASEYLQDVRKILPGSKVRRIFRPLKSLNLTANIIINEQRLGFCVRN